MSRRWISGLLLLVALMTPVVAEDRSETWAERLGYPQGRRVLILHCDDIGMCWEANEAAKSYLEGGHVQSAAVMVPCPWFNEFAAWARERPRLDIGLHLTLTSEWAHYRWGPVSSRQDVPGLVDPDGYLWRDVRSVATNASAEEIDTEIRAQIDRALAKGLRPGHIDTHMGTLYARLDYTKAYLKAAVDYDIPAMVIEMTPKVAARFRAKGYPISPESIRLVKQYPLPKLDDFHPAPAGKTYEEARAGFLKLVKSLDPGITEIIFHPALETEGLKKITNSWRQRTWEARMFADTKVKELFEKEGIIFTSWREMMRRHGAKR